MQHAKDIELNPLEYRVSKPLLPQHRWQIDASWVHAACLSLYWKYQHSNELWFHVFCVSSVNTSAHMPTLSFDLTCAQVRL